MKSKIVIILHWVIFLTTAGAICASVFGKPDVLGSGGLKSFRFYTTDSNVLACISSGLCLYFMKKKSGPHWMTLYQFVSTVAVSVTFLIALFFLAPTMALGGGGMEAAIGLFTGKVFFLHFSTPILSFVAMLLTGNEDPITKKEVCWALCPVVIYSLVYLVLVVFVGVWNDWYGFTFGGHYWLSPIILVVMYSFVALLAFGEWKLRKMLG